MLHRTLATVLLLIAITPLAAADDVDTPARTAAVPGVSVVIDSRPDHAEIRLDGKFVGTTPLSYRLPSGTHKIELVRPGFGPWLRELTVTDAPTRVVALLQTDAAVRKCSGE